MPLPDLFYPIETTSTVVARKRQEYSTPTKVTCLFDNTVNYLDFSPEGFISTESFTNFSLGEKFKKEVFKIEEPEIDLDEAINVPIKNTYKVNLKVKSISKLAITPFLD